MESSMDKTDSPTDIGELQANVIQMRQLYPDLITKYIKRINKIKINLLENNEYITNNETFEIPTFPLEEYEQCDLSNNEKEQKLKAILRQQIIVMQILLKKQTCQVTQLVKNK